MADVSTNRATDVPRRAGAPQTFDPSVIDDVDVRRVGKGEVEPALRLILAGDAGRADDVHVLDFLRYAVERGIDLNRIQVATVGRRVGYAMLPVPSPGRTTLLLVPQSIGRGVPPEAIRAMAAAVCAEAQAERIDLIQVLLNPSVTESIEIFQSAGFELLAELIYLHREVSLPATAEQLALPEGFYFEPYREDLHGLFVDTTRRTYESTLDCPALTGTRPAEDVVASHMASGEFRPGWWRLLMESTPAGPVGRGVLLLAGTANTDGLELVYLGLTPEVRGKALGGVLLRTAFDDAYRTTDGRRITLAVDRQNTPALRLYLKHGMRKIQSRVAMFFRAGG